MLLPKVLFLSDKMPLGGGSTSILNLSEGLLKSGLWDPHVAVFDSQDTIGEQIQQRGITFAGPYPGLIYEDRLAQMISFCQKIQPHVIVAALGGSAYDFLRFVPTGCARIAMIQSDDINVYNQTVRYASWIDIVVGVSKEICRKVQIVLKKLPISISYQPYGVPMPIKPTPPARTKNVRVLYLGRLFEEQKRVNLMARIIRSTLNSPFSFQWTIAGDGDELPKLRERFADCPARVSFLGGIPYDEVPALFAQNDVYFLCSNYEGLPLSLIEAMGAGLVPVVSDLPSGISEVVNSQNGIRVPIESESGYIDALLRLAADRGLLEEMAVESIAAVRNKFSIEAMTNRWLSILSIRQSDAIDWKRNFYATAPLQLQNKLVYQPIFRPLRRLFKRIPKRIWNAVVQP